MEDHHPEKKGVNKKAGTTKKKKAGQGQQGQEEETKQQEAEALIHKYMMLEREQMGLGRDLQAIEDEMKILQEEKLSLLDELVILEGLVNPNHH